METFFDFKVSMNIYFMTICPMTIVAVCKVTDLHLSCELLLKTATELLPLRKIIIYDAYATFSNFSY